MKKQIEKIGQVVVRSANVAGRGLSGVQHHAQDLGQVITHTVSKGAQDVLEKAGSAAGSVVSTAASTALQAKDLAVQSVTDVITHEKTKAIVEQVIDVSTTIVDGAGHGAKVVGTQVVDCVKKIDQSLEENHHDIKEKTEMVSMGFGVAAGVTAGAAIIGPPVVAAIAPVIGAAATVSGAVAGTAYFYSKWREKKAGAGEQALDSENKNTLPDAESSHKPV